MEGLACLYDVDAEEANGDLLSAGASVFLGASGEPDFGTRTTRQRYFFFFLSLVPRLVPTPPRASPPSSPSVFLCVSFLSLSRRRDASPSAKRINGMSLLGTSKHPPAVW